ncbi:paired amphipathic helix protein Sin3-like 5 isoform X2 [Cynara cardunculus var. scolymus]|uniref:paired amphipathic helix protein Sin3-like 5 isoform X2 n=1 Tax=Cynara cardunculus var. scolymus TaxID=59895 RepID=UPI000D62E979|nr:paired amphipathic helix protein Sin3-like 5 isoform X2 [Cynara cardunculus var. scolymus]
MYQEGKYVGFRRGSSSSKLTYQEQDVLIVNVHCISRGFNKLWKSVFAANHHMSLDHHGVYLEQQDSKFSSNNDLLAEIKDVSDGMYEDTKLEFMYSNMNIH